MIRAGIVGGTGYTGQELLRLLAGHPQVELALITSRGEAGTPASEMFPNLRGVVDLPFCEPDPGRLAECDVVFFATPHGTAMDQVPALLEAGVRVVDLGADFRIRDVTEWSRWYGMDHRSPEQVAQAVYGLPELNRAVIRGARLVANPGCYPTCVVLACLPLLRAGLVEPRVVASAASGVSGAGRAARTHTLLCEANESFKAYGAFGHRHQPEIAQAMADAAGAPVELTFVPHLLPMTRGMHATVFLSPREPGADLQQVLETAYREEPFVDVLPAGSHPETRSVRGTNLCRLALAQPPAGDGVVLLSVIDNLVKGASGQAVQNMNLMFGLEETAGLTQTAVLP